MSAIFAPFGPVADGDADIARLPRLDRHPGMHLAIIELERARVVDDHAGIVGIAARVELHDGEAAPDVVVDAGLLERRDLRPVERAHDRRIGVHRQAVQRVFGEDDEIHGRHVAARLADHRDDPRVCAARSAGVTTTGNCSCTRPITTPFGDLLRPPSPFISCSISIARGARRCPTARLLRHAQLAGHVARRLLGARGRDHDARA